MMWPYFVMVGAPAIAAVLGGFQSNKRLKNRIVLALFFLIWIILLCFRKETVGADTVRYHLLFINIQKMSFGSIFAKTFSADIEVGFYLLLKVISLFTTNFRVVIVIGALLCVIPVWILYRNNALQNSYLSVVMFISLGLFVFYCSAMRQAIAIGFMLPAYYFTKNRKPLLFILMVILAFMFHHSAFIMLLMYPVYHLKLRRYSILLLLVPIIIIVFIFRVPIFSALSSFIGEIYVGSIRSTGAIMIFLLLAILSLYCYLMPNNEALSDDIIGLRNLLVLATVLQIFSGINTLAMRFNYYYLLFVPILIPRIINEGMNKNRKLAEISYIVMVVFFTVWFFYQAYTGSDILQVFPYYPAWAR